MLMAAGFYCLLVLATGTFLRSVILPHIFISRNLSASEYEKEHQHGKYKYGKSQLTVNGVESALCIYKDDCTQQNRDLKQHCNTGDESQHDEHAAHEVSQCNIMCQENGIEIDGAVCNHGVDGIGVLNKEKTLEENDQS